MRAQIDPALISASLHRKRGPPQTPQRQPGPQATKPRQQRNRETNVETFLAEAEKEMSLSAEQRFATLLIYN